jgi:ribokinase
VLNCESFYLFYTHIVILKIYQSSFDFFLIARKLHRLHMKPIIVIAGSSNTDMVIKTKRIPAPGETVLGGTFFMSGGGKGANQAVAATRAGGNVAFICKTGDDIFGKQAVQLFKEEGINTNFILTDRDHPSGIALITVDENGENCIVVASGANATLQPGDLEQLLTVLGQTNILLMQLEIPLVTVEYLANVASSKNVKVILNPAPACDLSPELFKKLYIITPNEKEAEQLTGIKVTDLSSAEIAARALQSKGVEIVIITLGAQGALILYENDVAHIEGYKVDAVDTTAAGDVFNGALVVALSEGRHIHEAVIFACKAAAISVTRLGAQASAPYKSEVESSKF